MVNHKTNLIRVILENRTLNIRITLKSYSTKVLQVLDKDLYIYRFILNILNKTINKSEICEIDRI